MDSPFPLSFPSPFPICSPSPLPWDSQSINANANEFPSPPSSSASSSSTSESLTSPSPSMNINDNENLNQNDTNMTSESSNHYEYHNQSHLHHSIQNVSPFYSSILSPSINPSHFIPLSPSPFPSPSPSSSLLPLPLSTITPSSLPIAYSCLRCHTMKLSCDGNRPCARCIKTKSNGICTDRITTKGNKKPAESKESESHNGGKTKRRKAEEKSPLPSSLLSSANSLPISIPMPISMSIPTNQTIPSTSSSSSPILSSPSSSPSPSSPSLSPSPSFPVTYDSFISNYVLSSLFSTFPVHPPLHVDSLLFFSHFYSRLDLEDFAKVLTHFGYSPPLTSTTTTMKGKDKDSEYYLFSKWSIPSSSPYPYHYHHLPDIFDMNYSHSPIDPLEDVKFPNFSTMVLTFPIDNGDYQSVITSASQTTDGSDNEGEKEGKDNKKKQWMKWVRVNTNDGHSYQIEQHGNALILESSSSSSLSPSPSPSLCPSLLVWPPPFRLFPPESHPIVLQIPQVVVINREFERLFGWSQREIRLMSIQQGTKFILRNLIDWKYLIQKEQNEKCEEERKKKEREDKERASGAITIESDPPIASHRPSCFFSGILNYSTHHYDISLVRKYGNPIKAMKVSQMKKDFVEGILIFIPMENGK